MPKVAYLLSGSNFKSFSPFNGGTVEVHMYSVFMCKLYPVNNFPCIAEPNGIEFYTKLVQSSYFDLKMILSSTSALD